MILSSPPQLWHCRGCNAVARTFDHKIPMHDCKGMAGLHVPLLREGERAELVAEERGDFINGEDVQYDGNNRPIMSVTTKRDDGEDCTVYPPTAQGTGSQ